MASSKHARSGGRLLWVVAGLMLLGVALTLGLQTRAARDWIRGRVNAALADTFRGRIELSHIGWIGAGGVGGVDGWVWDPSGKRVLHVRGLSASVSAPALAWELVTGGDAKQLLIEDVRLDYAEIWLRPDEETGITLASAFLPAHPSAPEEEGAGIGVTIEHVEMDHVWAHGSVAGLSRLDAHVRDLEGSLSQSNEHGFNLLLDHAKLSAQGLPGDADPTGRLSASLRLPTEGPLKAQAQFEGEVARSPAELTLQLDGDSLQAQLQLEGVPAEYVNRRIDALQLQGPVQVDVSAQGELPAVDVVARVQSGAGQVALSGYVMTSGPTEAWLELRGDDLDLARLSKDAPKTELDFSGGVLLFEVAEGLLKGSQWLEVAPSRVAQETTPALAEAGSLRLDLEQGAHSEGWLTLRESGAEARGSYEVSFGAKGSNVNLALQGSLADSPRLEQLGLQARGQWSVTAHVAPESGELTADAELQLSRLSYQDVTLRDVQVDAEAAGPLADPNLQARASFSLYSGNVRAQLTATRDWQTLHATARNVSIEALAERSGAELPIQGGQLDLETEVRRQGDTLEGNLRTRARAMRLNHELCGEIRAEAELEDQKLSLAAHADLGRIGELSLRSSELALPSGAPSPAWLSRLSGEIEARGQVELAPLAGWAVPSLPLETADGEIHFELTAQQAAGVSGRPKLSLIVDTYGLRLVGQRKPQADLPTTAAAGASEPWSLEGIDLHLALRNEPGTDRAVGTLILRTHHATLAELQAQLDVGPPRDWASWSQRRLLHAPLALQLRTPWVDLAKTPKLQQFLSLAGQARLSATLDGSLVAPRVLAHVAARRLRASESSAGIDLRTRAYYRPDGGELVAEAMAAGKARGTAKLRATWQGDLQQALAGPTPALSGSAGLTLADFPLEAVPGLAERNIEGRLSAEAELKNWGKDAQLEARLVSSSLAVNDIPIERLESRLEADGSRLSAELKLDAPRGGRTRALLQLEAPWGARALPEVRPQGEVKLMTREFRLATLDPLVKRYVSQLKGVVNAKADLQLAGPQTRVTGQLELEQGVVQIPAIGQRLSDVRAQVRIHDDQIELTQLQAEGLTGRFTASGSGRLSGLELRSAKARARIKESEMMPLTLEGVALGDAWGRVDVAYQAPGADAPELTVEVPEFHLITPEKAGHAPRSLENAEFIRMGVRRRDGTFVKLPMQPLAPRSAGDGAPAGPPLHIVVKLGDHVTVARDRTAEVALTGRLEIVAAEEAQVTGRIQVVGGEIDVSGKTFEIERGVVSFEGDDPSNPTITATARWDAPEYTVYAEYLGDLETGHIKLHSEPPLSQDEIATLLLFGSPEGSVGGSAPGGAALALSVAGGTATKGLNRVLDDFTNLDISTRVDTSTGAARPELVFQVSPRVAAKVTRAIGAPAAGEAPDRTFLTLELRLQRSWALSALLGDRGASALDLIWRHRY